jgi:exosortase D (VPLPA-CTERM-specific)
MALTGFQSVRLPAFILAAVLLALLFYDFSNSLAVEIDGWSREEYSYGYLSPLVALLIARHRLVQAQPTPSSSWFGVAWIAVAVVLQIIGDLTAVHLVVQYAFLVALFGLVLTIAGTRTALLVVWGIIYLALAIPLPAFFYISLSTKMQLWSSTLGVDVLRLLGQSVFQEGNIIDLGSYKLQVAEACSGLRYLFPLVSFGYLAACLLDDRWWKRILLVASTVPITIVMNSLRIAVIGITVDQWGVSMAEGLLHGFEGWAVFLVCIAALMAEMAILVRIGHRGRIRYDYLTFGRGAMFAQGISMTGPMIVSFVLLVGAAIGIGGGLLSERTEVAPERKELADFPRRIGDWEGHASALTTDELKLLKLDDYILIDYRSDRTPLPVNFYVAYYQSQRKGESAHSPQTCIPGGGWEINGLTQKPIEGFSLVGHPLVVNRVVIQKGELKQLVYYWFQQRGRIMTNEYDVKWKIMVDALERNRTDGALVRLVTPISPSESDADADKRLVALLTPEWNLLSAYIPN